MADYVTCSDCGKRVSNSTGTEIVVRAYVQCPECLEKEPPQSWLKKNMKEWYQRGRGVSLVLLWGLGAFALGFVIGKFVF